MIKSNWKITFDHAGAVPLVLLDFGDKIENELPYEWRHGVEVVDLAAASQPFIRGSGNATTRLQFTVYRSALDDESARAAVLNAVRSPLVPLLKKRALKIEAAGENGLSWTYPAAMIESLRAERSTRNVAEYVISVSLVLTETLPETDPDNNSGGGGNNGGGNGLSGARLLPGNYALESFYPGFHESGALDSYGPKTLFLFEDFDEAGNRMGNIFLCPAWFNENQTLPRPLTPDQQTSFRRIELELIAGRYEIWGTRDTSEGQILLIAYKSDAAPTQIAGNYTAIQAVTGDPTPSGSVGFTITTPI